MNVGLVPLVETVMFWAVVAPLAAGTSLWINL